MLTTVVGHYPKIPNRPRPARLRQAIARYERGEISRQELARIEDEVTVEVIQEQIEAGIDIISDGQIRWEDDQTYIARRLSGFDINGLVRYLDTNTYFRQPVVVGEVRHRETFLVQDWRFAQKHSPRPVKAIVTGPVTLARLSRDEHYHDHRRLVMALAEALAPEVKALAEAGAPVVQVNEPLILWHPEDLPLLREALQVMLAGVACETALYTWFGSIERVYPQLLELPVTTIGIDLVSQPRNWQVLGQHAFPADRKLGAGIVDGRNTRLESVEEIVASVRHLTRIVPPDRLYLNPSCGLEYLPREVAQDKLRRLAEGARAARQALGVEA
ncbi:MAG TPA: methylcobamide--CoM methyltransferase [Dehalococcoidia bacterium]|nr:methylcobamide--CoM methyltransferase [Dehalococcoidia bacterium]